MHQTIDRARMEKSLRQIARERGLSAESVPNIPVQVEQLAALNGVVPYSRSSLLRIGIALLQTGQPHILAPCCPDYSHSEGRYDFRGLGGGVSLLAQQHIGFLTRVMEVLPAAQVTFLMANLEAEDSDIRHAVGKEKEAFVRLVEESLTATRAAIASRGWQAEMMTTLIPDLAEREHEIVAWINGDERFRARISSEAGQRIQMYLRIKPHYAEGEMERRTIRTAAQYVALGRFAAERGMIICNHTTTNLAWYGETEAGILHNPVAVY